MSEQNNYKDSDNYCGSAVNFQSVPSHEQYGKQHPDVDPKDYDTNRAQTFYSCPDNYQMGSLQDNHIYIATTDPQHDIIASGEKFKDHKDEIGAPSGFFSDQATVDACKLGEALDNTKYNEMCQIAPYRPSGTEQTADATYKPHVDCFEIDRDKLQSIYHTNDFNAAISKCEANNHFGYGGGNQGYNPYISEMMDNGTLKHRPEMSYSDPAISKSEHNNPNGLANSTVNAHDYQDMMRDAKTRAQDCVANNTSHPSPEACKNGYPPNPNPIESNTGNAKLIESSKNENSSAGPSISEITQPRAPANISDAQPAGAKTEDLPAMRNPQGNDGLPSGLENKAAVTHGAAVSEPSNHAQGIPAASLDSAQNAPKSAMSGGMT